VPVSDAVPSTKERNIKSSLIYESVGLILNTPGMNKSAQYRYKRLPIVIARRRTVLCLRIKPKG